MTVIQDIIDHLNSNWGAVVPKPGFHNGHRLAKDMELGTNYINIYMDTPIDYEDYDSAGLYRDETYVLLLEVGSVTSQTYMDNMVAEVERLLNTETVTGYHYNRVTDSAIRDSSEVYMTSIGVELKKLLQLKV